MSAGPEDFGGSDHESHYTSKAVVPEEAAHYATHCPDPCPLCGDCRHTLSAKPCCVPECAGEWGTNCPHCHHSSFLPELEARRAAHEDVVDARETVAEEIARLQAEIEQLKATQGSLEGAYMRGYRSGACDDPSPTQDNQSRYGAYSHGFRHGLRDRWVAERHAREFTWADVQAAMERAGY